MSKVLSMAKAKMKQKPKYYYHCYADSVPGKAMTCLIERCQKVDEIASHWVEQQGGINYIESPYGLAGGVSFVVFDKKPSSDFWQKEEEVSLDDSFDAEQIAGGAGLYKVNIPDDLDMRPYLKGTCDTLHTKKHGMAALAETLKQKKIKGIVPKPDTAIALAVERMQLPIVGIDELLDILHPVQRMITAPNGNKRPAPIALSSTPSFFEYQGYWFIEVPFAIEGEGWNDVSKIAFEKSRSKAMQEDIV